MSGNYKIHVGDNILPTEFTGWHPDRSKHVNKDLAITRTIAALSLMNVILKTFIMITNVAIPDCLGQEVLKDAQVHRVPQVILALLVIPEQSVVMERLVALE